MSRTVLSDYLSAIARVHETRAGTGEMSYYPALAGALNGIGGGLKPRVFCVPNLRNTGAGFPDIGLFAGLGAAAPAEWPEGRPPDRGVVEVDDIPAPLSVKLGSRQVADYLDRYGLVLVTNYREFVLLGRDARGQQGSAIRFIQMASQPRPGTLCRWGNAGFGPFIVFERPASQRRDILDPKFMWVVAWPHTHPLVNFA